MKRIGSTLLSLLLCCSMVSPAVLAETDTDTEGTEEPVTEVEQTEETNSETEGTDETETEPDVTEAQESSSGEPEETETPQPDAVVPAETDAEASAITEQEPAEETAPVQKSVTVIFDKNAEDAVGTMENQVFEANAEQKLNLNAYERTGYVFNGWEAESDGTVVHYEDGAAVTFDETDEAEITLYAVWEMTDAPVEETEEDTELLEEGEITSGKWEYIVEGSNATIVSYKGKDSHIDIPSVIDGRTVTAIGSGNSPFLNKAYYDGDWVYPSDYVESVSIPNTITKLNRYSFRNAKKLNSIIIPQGVTSLEDVFGDCSNLNAVTIPDSVTNISNAFNGCTSLQSVSLPQSVTNMNNAFVGCTSLTNVNIPIGVTTLSYTFSGCISLNNISIPDGVTSMFHTFDGCTGLTQVTIPENATTLNSAFRGCTGLTKVIIPSKVNYLSGTFAECTNLEEVTFQNDNVSLYDMTFKNCYKLQRVNGTALQSIGKEAFQNCKALTSVPIIRDSFSGIGEYSFDNCPSLKRIAITNKIKTVNTGAFRGSMPLTVDFYGTQSEWSNLNILPLNDRLQNATVIYHIPAEEISIKQAKPIRLMVGETVKVTPVPIPANAELQKITWQSYNTAVATVDENGVVTAVSEGSAGIQMRDTLSGAYGGFTVMVTNEPTTVDMHRMYNPNSGEHFYTGNVAERDHLISLGWNYEGVGFKAPKTSDTPMYRLYNPNAGDHHYTSNRAERDHLIDVGWNYEGIGWYADDNKEVPQYRLYNPNATGAGSHHYTDKIGERNYLISIGWKDEGIGFYTCK